jgi:hypothetical protein
MRAVGLGDVNLSFVGRRLSEVIDDEYLDRNLAPFQLQSEFLESIPRRL